MSKMNNMANNSVPDEIYQKACNSLVEKALLSFPENLDDHTKAMLKFKISEGMLEVTQVVLNAVADDLRAAAWSEGWGAGMTGETENPYTLKD